MINEGRFWSKVDKNGPVPECSPDLGPCWMWTAGTTSGYGYFWFDGKMRLAHRLTYEHFVGPIPDGLEPDHLCRVRSCVNPSHLEPVTHRVNALRGSGHTAANAVKTHCEQGHPLEGGNLYIRPNGWRECRTCKRETWKRWRAKEPR